MALFLATKQSEVLERSALVHELFVQLRVHWILEQQLLFPQVLPVIGRERVCCFGQDFFVMLALMLELEQLDSGGGDFERVLESILLRFRKHVFEQESSLFPELHGRLSELELTGIDCRFNARREELCEKMRCRTELRSGSDLRLQYKAKETLCA